MFKKENQVFKTANGSAEYLGGELELFAAAKNWKKYWSSRIKPLIKAPVLEVGAGVGSNLSLLKEGHSPWLALEPDHFQASKISELISSLDLEHASVFCGTIFDLEPQKKFMTIVYIDVLEHIDDDRSEVVQALNLLDSGGQLIVLSPAHNRLFSPFDSAVGHYRRYDKKSLKALTPLDGTVEIQDLYYLDSMGCIASYINSSVLKSSMPTMSQILFWDRVMVPMSRFCDVVLRRKIGKTVVMIWKKID